MEKWNKITIDTTTEAVDAISYQLEELGIKGIEIIDHVPLSEEDRKTMYVDLLPDEIAPDDGTAKILCYIDDHVDVESMMSDISVMLQDMSAFFNVGAATVSLSETKDEDWVNNWKKYFKPFRLDDNIIINDLKNHLVARPSIVHFVIAFSELIEDRDLGKFLKSVFKIYPAFTFYLSNYYLFLKPSFSTYFLGLLDIEKKENRSKSSRIQFLMAHSLYRVFDDDFEEIMEECSKYKDLYNPAFCLDKNSKTFIQGTIEYLETQGNILVSAFILNVMENISLP